MAIPLNPLSDRKLTYKSKVDYLSLRSSVACPAKYTLFLTNGCNLVCDMCTQLVVGINKRHFMSLELLDKILEETAWTYPIYTLFGGEPLLHPKFTEIIEKISRTGCEQEIVTNGFYLGENIDVIVGVGCDLIISLSGIEGINNAVKHNNQSFNKIKNAIYDIGKKSRKYLSEKVSINCVVIPDNIDTLDDFITELHSWGIKKVTFQHPQWLDNNIKSQTDKVWQSLFGLPYDTQLKMHKSYDFNDSYIATLLQRKDTISDNQQDVDIKFFPELSDIEIRMYYDNFGCMMIDSDDVCLTPWLNPMIQEDGEVKSCTGYSIGNIKDSSFWELWNGEKNLHFRKELMLRRKYSVCNRCCMMYQKTGDYGK